MSGFESTAENISTIVAALTGVATIGTLASRLLVRHDRGAITPEQLTAEWADIETRLHQAVARWRAAGVPPVDTEAAR